MKYDTLVSSGFTSPVIAGLLLDRDVQGALEVAGDVRARHDGRHRSPWNEPECGLLYSRAMAHWNIYDQACGHTYDSVTGALAFEPRTIVTAGGTSHFKCFYTVHGGWGEFSQTGPAGLPSGDLTLSVLWGRVQLRSLRCAPSLPPRVACSMISMPVPVAVAVVVVVVVVVWVWVGVGVGVWVCGCVGVCVCLSECLYFFSKGPSYLFVNGLMKLSR